jgi:acyl-[acyl carrier protein]--UDP-N-acetylglucosamine O-acyltransferase
MFYSAGRQNGTTLSGTDKVAEHKPIRIGNDVFIGMNVTVLDGVTIGDGAVIGAGCVVSKDVPPYAIVVGCPMQILRYRFPEDLRRRLAAVRWWDFSEDDLRLIERHFFDVEAFVSLCEERQAAQLMPGSGGSRDDAAIAG